MPTAGSQLSVVFCPPATGRPMGVLTTAIAMALLALGPKTDPNAPIPPAFDPEVRAVLGPVRADWKEAMRAARAKAERLPKRKRAAMRARATEAAWAEF